MKRLNWNIFVILLFLLTFGCKTTQENQFEQWKKNLLPEFIENDDIKEVTVTENSVNLPETSFDNVTVKDLEDYYRKTLRRGAVYFVGFDPEPDAKEERRSLFVTGDLKNQLTEIAVKFGGKVYQLGDDWYVVKLGQELDDVFTTSAVFVSSLKDETIQEMLTLYNLQGKNFGLQTVARGSLLDLVEFQKVFNSLSQSSGVYLIDLAFIDFTIQESANFQAYLVANSVDLLKVSNFADVFSMYLNVDVDNLRSRNFYSQSLLASDGNESKFDVGTTHSRESRAISDQGTSTVSGYSDISDGFQLTFTPQSCIGNYVVCTVTLENSAFTDDDYNTKSETSLDVKSVPFQLGNTYYLSSLTNVSKKRGVNLFGLDFESIHRVQTCWCRVRKIK